MHRTFLVDSYPSPAVLTEFSTTQATQNLLKKWAICFSGPHVTIVLHTTRIGHMESHALFRMSSLRLLAATSFLHVRSRKTKSKYEPSCWVVGVLIQN